MAYEKTVWSNGDVITAEKLNKIENALEDKPVYNIIDDNLTPRLVEQLLSQKKMLIYYQVEDYNNSVHCNYFAYTENWSGEVYRLRVFSIYPSAEGTVINNFSLQADGYDETFYEV